jgi:hypothetical protein
MGNRSSRADPAQGSRKRPPPPANPRDGTDRKPCPRRESPQIPTQLGSATTGLSRRRSRVRVPSLPLLEAPANSQVALSDRTRRVASWPNPVAQTIAQSACKSLPLTPTLLSVARIKPVHKVATRCSRASSHVHDRPEASRRRCNSGSSSRAVTESGAAPTGAAPVPDGAGWRSQATSRTGSGCWLPGRSASREGGRGLTRVAAISAPKRRSPLSR